MSADSPPHELTYPPLLLDWDVRAANSAVGRTFAVKEHRYYQFQIAFQGGITAESSEDRVRQLRELYKFTGSGGLIWVTRESADTENPVKVMAVGDELMRGVRSGEYVSRQAKDGVMIPVHLTIESQGESSEVVFDRTVQTWSIDGGTQDGLVRGIASVELRPGRYKLLATTTQSTPLPANLHTALRVTYRPDTQLIQSK